MVTIETQLSQDIVTESATFPVLFYGKLIGCYFESLPYISFFPRTEFHSLSLLHSLLSLPPLCKVGNFHPCLEQSEKSRI